MSGPLIETLHVQGVAGRIALRLQGDVAGAAVLMTHSILSSSAMWDRQAAILAAHGYRVVRMDTRGHGGSDATAQPFGMDDLADDAVAVLDALGIQQAHYVGLSLGAMSGFGLALRHAHRLASLCLCDGRADAPPAVAAPWDERIAIALRDRSCQALARPTVERWFGQAFMQAASQVAQSFVSMASSTSVDGFVGCARAIQKLDYLARIDHIDLPTTLIVGSNDGVLPEVMAELATRMPRAVLAVVADAGHLPNIDQPDRFDAVLLQHFQRVSSPCASRASSTNP